MKTCVSSGQERDALRLKSSSSANRKLQLTTKNTSVTYELSLKNTSCLMSPGLCWLKRWLPSFNSLRTSMLRLRPVCLMVATWPNCRAAPDAKKMRTRSSRINVGILKIKCMTSGMLSLPCTSNRTQRCSKPAVCLKMGATIRRMRFSGTVGKWRRLTSFFPTWLRSATLNNMTLRTRQRYYRRTPLPSSTYLTLRVFSNFQPRTA